MTQVLRESTLQSLGLGSVIEIFHHLQANIQTGHQFAVMIIQDFILFNAQSPS